MEGFDKRPDLSRDFPGIDPNLKIFDDLNNTSHGGSGHFDVIQGIDGGVDKIRLSEDGGILGGTTQFGGMGMDWGGPSMGPGPGGL